MATFICSEKSSGVGSGVTLTGVHVASTLPNAWSPRKLRNQCSFCSGVVHLCSSKNRSDDTRDWAVPWQLRQPENGLSTGPLARPGHPQMQGAKAGDLP